MMLQDNHVVVVLYDCFTQYLLQWDDRYMNVMCDHICEYKNPRRSLYTNFGIQMLCHFLDMKASS